MKMTEDQEMYLKILKEFIAQEVAPRVRELDEVDEYPMWMRDRMVELGFTKLVAPEAYDGIGESLTTMLLLIMEASKVNNSLASLLNCSNTANKLISFGTQQQIDAFIPRILEEGRFMGMAYSEASSGSDSRAIQTTAVLDGDEWVLNGTKTFISYRSAVGVWQVSAKTTDESGKEGISVFLVDAAAEGVSYGAHYNKFGWCGSDTGDIYFKNCRVPKWCVAGQINKGLRISLSTLDGARLVIAARALGYAQGAFDKAFAYASERIAFRQTINQFQAIQHYFADMYASIDIGKGYVFHLANMLENGEDIAKSASIAKLYCTEETQKICEKAMQICGGMGLLEDFGLARFYRDARVLTIGEGTTEIQKNIIFKDLLKNR